MIRALLPALLAVPLAGCAISMKVPDGKVCRPEGAIGYIGQRYTDRIGRIVKDKTQATYVRPVAPDTMVTQDLRPNRINIALDEKNTVTRIYCG